jgi:hypothetical protein
MDDNVPADAAFAEEAVDELELLEVEVVEQGKDLELAVKVSSSYH